MSNTMETKKIELGELFEVAGKMYVIVKPKALADSPDLINEHNQIVFQLIEIE